VDRQRLGIENLRLFGSLRVRRLGRQGQEDEDGQRSPPSSLTAFRRAAPL
jgi:hypothetical protein